MMYINTNARNFFFIYYFTAMRNKKAFTLLELMVAMGIIAVLAAMSVYGISIVQQSLRNTQRRKNLEDVNLAINQFFESYGTYPVAGTELVFAVDQVQIGRPGDVTSIELNGAGQGASGGVDGETSSSETAYCYATSGGSYQLGVDLEGTDWGFQLGEPSLPDCTTNSVRAGVSIQ